MKLNNYSSHQLTKGRHQRQKKEPLAMVEGEARRRRIPFLKKCSKEFCLFKIVFQSPHIIKEEWMGHRTLL